MHGTQCHSPGSYHRSTAYRLKAWHKLISPRLATPLRCLPCGFAVDDAVGVVHAVVVQALRCKHIFIVIIVIIVIINRLSRAAWLESRLLILVLFIVALLVEATVIAEPASIGHIRKGWCEAICVVSTGVREVDRGRLNRPSITAIAEQQQTLVLSAVADLHATDHVQRLTHIILDT